MNHVGDRRVTEHLGVDRGAELFRRGGWRQKFETRLLFGNRLSAPWLPGRLRLRTWTYRRIVFNSYDISARKQLSLNRTRKPRRAGRSRCGNLGRNFKLVGKRARSHLSGTRIPRPAATLVAPMGIRRISRSAIVTGHRHPRRAGDMLTSAIEAPPEIPSFCSYHRHRHLSSKIFEYYV